MPDIWKKKLSEAWDNADLSKDDYDYDKYYKDQPIAAWLLLLNILANKWNPYLPAAHFPDSGRSGIYKTPHHPTYPDLGNKSWNNDGSIYYLSRQLFLNPLRDSDTDRTLDYLGSDYNYHKGGTHVVYNGANVLPTIWVFGKNGRTLNAESELRPNKYNTGYEYKDRKLDIKIPFKLYGGIFDKLDSLATD